MQLSPIKNRSEAEFGKANHFIYSGGHLSRQKKDCTINDDTISVGSVHIGLLYNIHVSNKEVYINETDKMTADWIDKSNLAEFYEGMETWTKITFDFYIK